MAVVGLTNGNDTITLEDGTVVAYADALNQMIFVGLDDISSIVLY